MNRRMTVLAGCFSALTLIACASTPPPPTGEDTQPAPTPGTEAPPTPTQPEVQPPMPASEIQVTGTVFYRERIALTPEAVVKVAVVEMTPDGAPGKIIGDQTLSNPGQVPIRFSVAVPADRIRADVSYTVRATITDGARNFSTAAPVPVLTQGAQSSDVQVMVRSGG